MSTTFSQFFTWTTSVLLSTLITGAWWVHLREQCACFTVLLRCQVQWRRQLWEFTRWPARSRK